MNGSSASRFPRAAWLLVGISFGVFAVTSAFGIVRHMHVDEVGALFGVRLLERHGLPHYAVPAELYLVLLAPFARLCDSTADLWLVMRVLYAILLLSLCVGLARWQRSLAGPWGQSVALLVVVTCAPLFRHGFEVRHDQFFALALLAVYRIAERARERGTSTPSLAAGGALLALTQACSFKAIVTLGPALALAIWLGGRAAPHPRRAWLGLSFAAALGFATAALLAAAVMHATGTLPAYVDAQRYFFSASSAPPYRLRLWPLLTLVLSEAPVHSALAVAGAVATLARARQLLNATGFLPLCFAGIAAFSVLPNPTLFSYNLIWLSVPLLLLTFEGVRVVWQAGARIPSDAIRRVAAIALLVVVFVSWSIGSFGRFRTRTFDGQLQVVASAEALTLPHEPVLDMSGLVASRPPPAKDWLVHSLLVRDVREGRREKMRDVITRVAPPVVVSGQYRMELLDPADRRMIAENYVPVTHELVVLGAWLPEQGNFELLRSGPYGIDAGWGESDHQRACRIDGRVLRAGERRWLERGGHVTERMARPCRLRWLGPPGMAPPQSSFDSPLFERPSLPGQR